MTWEVCCRKDLGKRMANYNERGRRLISCTSKDPFIHEYEAKGDDIDNQIKCNFLKKREKTS